jgi:U6 snRNA-associated Sm-like protein LSm1
MGLYADIPKGIFLVRGENVLLLGEIDLDKDDDPPPGYEKAEAELVHKLAKERKARESRIEKVRLGKLKELGFEGENTGEALI